MGAGFLGVTWGYLVELSTIILSKTYSARFVGTDHMVERVATNVAATDSSRKNCSIPSDPQFDRHPKFRESRRSIRPWGVNRIDVEPRMSSI